MSSLYIDLGAPESSLFWLDSVANIGALPVAGATIGEARLVRSNGQIYWWNGATWVTTDPSGFVQATANTNSINLTVTTGTLRADLNLSAAAADAGNLKQTFSIKSDGLFIETPFATAAATGVLTAADWTTFNSKEPAIAAGTTSQYWRGDKSFQALNTDALTPSNGTAHASGKIGEIISSSVTTATTTGVAATGVYGDVTSVSLPAGQYLLTGVAGFSENGATLTTSVACGFSASADGSALGTLDPAVYNNLVSSTSDLVAPVPTLVVSPTVTTSYHLNTRFFYTSGTPQHYGRITATRIT